MKTTLNPINQVLRQAKDRAVREGTTLTKLVEDALRAQLKKVRDGEAAFRMRLKFVKRDRPPIVNISDRDALYDVIASDTDVLMTHIESGWHRLESVI